MIRDSSDKRQSFQNSHIIFALSPELATVWASTDLKQHSMEFWKINQLPFVNTCISTLSFYEASHPYLWLWGLLHSDPYWKGLNSYHSQDFLQPQGLVWFCAILSHFIPSIWFKCFITNSWLSFRKRGKKEIEKKKQNSTSLKTGKHSGLNFLSDSGQVSWQLVIWTYFRFQSKFHRALLPPSGPPLENKKMQGLA